MDGYVRARPGALYAAEAGDYARRWRCISIRPPGLSARPWPGSPTVRGLVITARRAADRRGRPVASSADPGHTRTADL